jgi:hypothetical protein
MTDHLSNHDQLLRRLDWRPGTRLSGRPLDAIIVPAARRAQHLQAFMDLAACYGTTLVVLASHDCDVEEAAALMAQTPRRGRAVFVNVPLKHEHDLLRLETSGDQFRAVSGDRLSNLSLKRNLGLLLARLRGWNKIMFLDDDVTVTLEQVARVAHHLDGNRFAGLKTVSFPDNSVVCHANRRIGRPQGIFVSGAALGVNTSAGRRLDVFPDVYNEDWFAFAGEASSSGVAHVGNVRQLPYNPFENPQRAAHEEFGDLVAEGLYALFNDGLSLSSATATYWAGFIGERRRLIAKIASEIDHNDTHELVQAAKSLKSALYQLDMVTPSDCTDFLKAWQEDRHRFDTNARRLIGRHSYADAFSILGLDEWQETQFGIAKMPALASVSPLVRRR